MSSRLRNIQQLWLAVMGTSLILAVLATYALRDGAIHDVVHELQRFEQTFDSATVSQALTNAARIQGQVPLSQVAAAIVGPGVPDMQFASSAVALPRGEVKVGTLAEAKKRQEAGDASIGVLQGEALGKALAFLIARAAEAGPLLLQSIDLLPTALSEKDAQLLLDAEDARLATVSTQKSLVAAQAEQERLETLYEQRAKWRAPVKVLQKTGEQRAEARAARSAAQAAWKAASSKYQQIASAALALKVEASVDGPLTTAIAMVTFARVEGQPPLILKVPTALKVGSVPLPALSGIDFANTERAGLWPDVSSLDPSAAVARAQQEFTFFSKGVAIGSVQITGSLVLQLGASLLPLLLWLILLRSKTAAKGYDPFAATQESLPQVGLRSDAMNLLTTCVLPSLVAGLCAYSLWRLGQWPLLAAPAAIATIFLGVRAKNKLSDLRELKAAVVRTVSTPPNAPLSISPLPPRSVVPATPKDDA